MSLSVRVRFEVFKRDSFTCQYCGKHPPDVLLEVDHIVPRAAGGTDDITNLTTACKECNGGKSSRLLEEGTAPVVNRAVVDDLRERTEQAAAYVELVGQQEGLTDKQIGLVNQRWAHAFRADTIEEEDRTVWRFDYPGRFPDEASVRRFLRQIPVAEVIAAIDITASRFTRPDQDTCLFFYKICWRRIKGESGPIDGIPRSFDDADSLRAQLEDLEIRYHELSLANTDLMVAASQVRDQIAERDELIRDLQITVRRLREEAGRE